MAAKKEPTQEQLEQISEQGQQATEGKMALAVQDMPITWQMIRTMAASNSLPVRYKDSPGDVITVMKMGQELGISPLEALNEIYVVNGKPSASGKLLAALIWRAGHVIMCDPSPEGATVRSFRKIEGRFVEMPEVSFTVEDAKRAGLMSKDTYKQYPQSMMAWRAITLAARVHFPDVVSSIGYTPEEAGLEDLDLMEATNNVVEVLDAEIVDEVLFEEGGE